jgi:hypothetical protein
MLNADKRRALQLLDMPARTASEASVAAGTVLLFYATSGPTRLIISKNITT